MSTETPVTSQNMDTPEAEAAAQRTDPVIADSTKSTAAPKTDAGPVTE